MKSAQFLMKSAQFLMRTSAVLDKDDEGAAGPHLDSLGWDVLSARARGHIKKAQPRRIIRLIDYLEI